MALGRLQEAFADYLELREVAQGVGDEEQECRALIGLTVVANFERDLALMERYGSEAMALAGKIGHSGLEAEATNNWATYMQVTGRLADAAQYWQKSVPLARSLGHRQALGHGLRLHGLMRFWKSEYHAAEAMGYEAVQVAAEVRDGFNLPLAHFYLGLTLGNLGKISDAMAALQESLDFARRNDHGVALARAPNGIGWLWREIGDIGKAIEFDAGSVEVARSAGLAEAESNALANLVYDYIAAGELGKAAEALESAYAVSDRELYNHWRYFGIRYQAAAAEFWLALGKLDRGREHASILLQNASNHGVPKYIAVARRLLGQIAALDGDHHTAEVELTCSLEVFATHPEPLIEWRNHLALARLLSSRNRPAFAREEFARAHLLVQRLTANINDPTLRQLFLQTDAVREVLAGATAN
jgi:tetratricopeptide (TPR) repeat protein